MAPLKALPKSVSDAKKKGLVPVPDFFGPKVKRGRRTMAAWKAGRPATKVAPAALPEAAVPTPVPTPAPKITMQRKSWSKGNGLEIMTAAVAAWGEELKKPEDDQISMAFFAKQRGIPSSTLHGHVTFRLQAHQAGCQCRAEVNHQSG